MNALSATLVVAQFVFIALILSPVSNLFGSSISALIGLALICLSIVLALWAIVTMRLANFSVLPEPVSRGELITSGPYQFIRHPMYSAVVFACLGAAISHTDGIKWIWMFCLCVVIALKIRREEALLSSRYNEYEQYSQKTKALIPYVF